MDLGAVLTFAGVVVAALGALVGVLFKRLSDLEARVRLAESKVKASESYTRRLWLWAKFVIDLYYRHRVDGAPEPPPIPEETAA